MKKNKLIYLLILALTAEIISCGNSQGTATGNPLVNLNITGAAQPATAYYKKNKKTIWDFLINPSYAFPPPASLLDKSGLPVTLSDFWVSFSEIELKYTTAAEIGEVDGDSIEFAGQYTVNLFSSSPSSVATSSLQRGSIRRIKYKTRNISDLTSGAPGGMLNSSLYLSGNVNGRNFIFKSTEQLTLETSGPNLVTFASGDHLLLQIKTADLIRKIDLSTITNGTTISEGFRVPFANPCPLISATAPDVYTCFIKGIQLQNKVGKDDGDNVFSVGEETIN